MGIKRCTIYPGAPRVLPHTGPSPDGSGDLGPRQDDSPMVSCIVSDHKIYFQTDTAFLKYRQIMANEA